MAGGVSDMMSLSLLPDETGFNPFCLWIHIGKNVCTTTVFLNGPDKVERERKTVTFPRSELDQVVSRLEASDFVKQDGGMPGSLLLFFPRSWELGEVKFS